MSRKLEIQVEKLFRMVEDLEKRLAVLEVGDSGTGFYIKRGFQSKYDVYNGEQKVNDAPMSKDDAEKMAEELNEAAA